MKDLRSIKTSEISLNQEKTQLALKKESPMWRDPKYISFFDAKIDGSTFLIGAAMTLFITEEWDHIIIRPIGDTKCTPSYEAMSKIKSSFFDKAEYAMQVIPRRENYVSIEPFTLHLWNLKSLIDFQFNEVYEYINTLDFDFSDGFCVKVSTDSCDNEYMAIICEKDWPCWDKVVELKEKFFGDTTDAIIVNRSFEQDIQMFDNQYKVILLWEASQIELPSKILV